MTNIRRHKDVCTDHEVQLLFKVMLDYEVNNTQVLSKLLFCSTVCTFGEVDLGAVHCAPST